MVDPPASYEEDLGNGAEVCDPSDNEEGSVIEEEVVEPPTHSSENKSLAVVNSAPEAQEDVPKKSYASIVSCFLLPCVLFYFIYLFFDQFFELHVLLHFVISTF